MSRTRTNIIANFAGRGVSGMLGFVCVPFYLKYLGTEAYGLVGFFTTLTSIFGLMDLGLSATLNREFARMSGESDARQQMRTLLRSMEYVYWMLAVICGLIIVLATPWIAHNWLKAQLLPQETIMHAIYLIGLLIAVQWPLDLYLGGLAGLQQQVLQNVLTSGFGIVRNAGGIVVVVFFSATIEALFVWHLAVSFVQTTVTGIMLWRCLPSGERAKFSYPSLKSIASYAGGITAITLTSVILTQADKIILSKVLALNQFGLYTLAGTACSALSIPVGPVFSAVFPNMTQKLAAENSEAITDLYHKACQLIAIVVLPAAAVLIFFSHDLLFLWTQSVATADSVSFVLSILAVGTALNALMNMPYALQLAHGWTSLGVWVNGISTVLLIPATLFLIGRFGTTGAAMTWVLLNVGYLVVTIPLMHRRLLKDEMTAWYLYDVLLPSLAAVAPVFCFWNLIASTDSLATRLTFIVFAGLASLVTTTLACSRIRKSMSGRSIIPGMPHE